MKKLNKTLAVLLAGSLFAMGANAATSNQAYVGVKAGQISLDEASGDSLDDATAYGVYGGYQFTPNLGIEAEYLRTNDTDLQILGQKGEYQLDTLGLFATYKHAFDGSPLFAKGKVGVVRTSGDFELNDFEGKESAKETDIALGAALGYALTPAVDLQGEYQFVTGDTDSQAWTVGVSYKF